MDRPTVSVIITTFNRENMVIDTINSVLNQDFQDFEIIVVDDCSSDNTSELFNDDLDPRIKYYRHEKNKGVQFSSKTGFSHSKGKYVAFIGDDDIWTKNYKLRKQVEILDNDTENRIGIVTTSVKVLQDDHEFVRIIKHPKNIIKHLLKTNGIIYGSCALLRRDAYIKAGGFVEELPKGTDSDVFRRIVLLGYDVHFIEEAMVDYNEINQDRMTLLNEKGVMRSIQGLNYIFKTYSHYLDLYPSVKSYRYYWLANMYSKLFQLKKNYYIIKTAKRMYFKSWCCYPMNIKALYKFLFT